MLGGPWCFGSHSPDKCTNLLAHKWCANTHRYISLYYLFIYLFICDDDCNYTLVFQQDVYYILVKVWIAQWNCVIPDFKAIIN